MFLKSHVRARYRTGDIFSLDSAWSRVDRVRLWLNASSQKGIPCSSKLTYTVPYKHFETVLRGLRTSSPIWSIEVGVTWKSVEHHGRFFMGSGNFKPSRLFVFSVSYSCRDKIDDPLRHDRIRHGSMKKKARRPKDNNANGPLFSAIVQPREK